MSEASQRSLQKLTELWREEQRAVHERFVEQRKELTLAERVERGLALRSLQLLETDAAVGGRVVLWLAPARLEDLDDLQIGPGDPVRLWWDNPDGDDAVLGVFSRRRPDRFAVMVDGDYPDELEDGGFHLDSDEPQVTFARGLEAIEAFAQAVKGSDLLRLREVLLGERVATFGLEPDVDWLDPNLNAPQHRAVRHALAADDIALIHGPPGTGKTRTLVEIIRQAVARGERVLATAASNAAVDNMAERLIDEGVSVVRLGHPARVASAVEAHTLDALVETTGAYQLARKWIIEGNNLRRKVNNRSARDAMRRNERRELLREAHQLFRDARQQLKGTQQAILAKASVVCATAVGVATAMLRDTAFDRVVLDEATQAPDPIALIALARAPKAVLAGDPHQLPPTVISLEAERKGLGTTLFERLAALDTHDALRLLTVQYRMHKTIMAFPSESMYEGKLIADASVAEHTLMDRPGVHDDPLRPGPFVFLDTAGKGWDEKRDADDPSTSNPPQAERVAAEVQRLLGRGVAPADVAVITPYNAQVRRLRDLLAKEVLAGLEIGSVDGFQGREKEAIVIDMVRSNIDGDIGFLADTRRMNVALTRARRFLLVVGDSATLGQHPYYAAFLEAVETLNAWRSAWDDDAPPFPETYEAG